MTAQAIIGEMVRRVVERFQPERVILFGSHARGDAGPNSDVDLLVVFRDAGHKRRKAVEIYRALAGMGLSKDVIVVNADEVERYRDVPGTIIRPALREGKVLYERTR
jgi:predicted nucleotidyltransferase